MLNVADAANRAAETRISLGVILGRSVSPSKVVTCEACEWNDNCEFAWDLYNTDGDCLAIK
jgi:hypothetical protein